MSTTPPVGAEPSPEEAAANEIHNHNQRTFTKEEFKALTREQKRIAAIVARHFAPLRAELERVKGERDIYRKEWSEGQYIIHRCGSEIGELKEHHQRDEAMIVQRTDEVRLLTSDLSAARARIGELEKQRDAILTSDDPGSVPWLNNRNGETLLAFLEVRKQLALANAKAEEAARSALSGKGEAT